MLFNSYAKGSGSHMKYNIILPKEPSASNPNQTNKSYSTNSGFDGASYQRLWPNGNTNIHPSPFKFTSPLTGPNYTKQYRTVGFETDLPDIEQPICNRSTGVGCTLISDDRFRPAGGILSLLYHQELLRPLLLAVRQRYSGRDQQLRAEQSVRCAAAAVVHPGGWPHRRALQRLPEHHSQPVPADLVRSE